jgi:hypothetical protein
MLKKNIIKIMVNNLDLALEAANPALNEVPTAVPRV